MSEINELAGGRYLIQEPLGEGGSGSIFKAWDQQLGRMVALKRIKENPSIEASIRHEAGVLATLDHPNVVTVFDYGSDENGHFVVMEMLNGRTLEAIIQEQPLTVPKFLVLMNQICRGLHAAHCAGLVHCDLKPANIMLQHHRDGSFTAKVLDFGLATTSVSTAGAGIENTGEGRTIQGSPLTIAPEQLMGYPADIRSDIYSLGCTFYYALCGLYPHDADDVQGIVQSHLYHTAKPLHRVKADIPEPLSIAIMKMLNRDPEGRPQDVEKARLALEGAARAPSMQRRDAGSRVIPDYSRRNPTGALTSTILPPPHAVPPPAPIQQVETVQYSGGVVPEAVPSSGPSLKTQIIISCSSLALIAVIGAVFWFNSKKSDTDTPAADTKPPAAEVAPENKETKDILAMINGAPSATPAPKPASQPRPPAPTPRPQSAQSAPGGSGSKSNAPLISARDLTALNRNKGKLVKIESQVESSMESSLVHAYLLRLKGSPALVSIPSNKMNAQTASNLVGRQISAVGTVTDMAGTVVVQLEGPNDLSSHP